MNDILIKNGTIIDGTGAQRYKADILVHNKKIQQIAGNIKKDAKIIVDAYGSIVTPGFIDTHRHFDLAVLDHENFGEIELRQGITSSICGNCGLSTVPLDPDSSKQYIEYLAPILGTSSDILTNLDFKAYSNLITTTPKKINVGFLAGANTIAQFVLKHQKRGFNDDERHLATKILENAFDAGAKGLSLGLMYFPEFLLSAQDHIEMAKTTKINNGILCTHIRGEGDSLVDSVKEVVEIAEMANIHLNISHFKAVGIQNWGSKIYEAIKVIEKAQNRGVDITVDFYPYDGGSTTLLSLIPPSIYPNSLQESLYFATPKGKSLLKKELTESHPKWDNIVQSIGWDRIIINSTLVDEYKPIAGMSIESAYKYFNYNQPSDLVGDLIASDPNGTSIILMSMNESDIEHIGSLPYSYLISDSLYSNTSIPHPRLYGAFPKFIQDFSIRKQLLTLECAIQKMTSLPAKFFGLENRGILRKGYFADILIFKPLAFLDHATYLSPRNFPTGLDHVFINGNYALQHDIPVPGYFGDIL